MFAISDMDRLLLVASTLCFLAAFACTMHGLGARRRRPSRFDLATILAGFGLQTAFLFVRGNAIGRCPVTNLSEVLIFLSWSMVIFYFVIGPTYRLSLLGFFTAPLAFLLQTTALLLPPRTATVAGPADFWLELHGALSVMAYGAFALGCVAGVMYLVQERQLKTHQINSIFHHLPPISVLAVANRRLVSAGLILLTAGLLSGLFVNRPLDPLKSGWGVSVWLVYGLILVMQTDLWRRLSPRRAAALSVGAFAFTLCSLWSLRLMY